MCYALSMEKTILVVTDIHYISPAIHHFNDAFLYQMANEDGRMTILSDEIMEALVCYVISRKPDVFVITGDLSWNGDLASHQEMRNYLLRIQKAGIEVYVIPGNHDIGKERAKYYAPFCSVLPECADKNDFANIYAPFMIKDDAGSFSYVKETDGIRMLCIDVNGTDHQGIVNEETFSWIEKRMSENNMPCIAFSHQNFLVLHPMFAKRRITNGDDLLRLFRKYHIHIGFSGHSHLQRIAKNKDFTDICTACLSAYEHHIGVIQINDDVVHYHTESLPVTIPADKQKNFGISCSEDEKEYFLSSIRRMMKLDIDHPQMDNYILSFFDGHVLPHHELIHNIENSSLSAFLKDFEPGEKDMNQTSIEK